MTTENTAATGDDDTPMVRRFATEAERNARNARIEQATDIVTDAGRAAEEAGPRDKKPHEPAETIPSVSAILIAMALADVAAAVREVGVAFVNEMHTANERAH
jgi:hypothetical protein